MQQEWLSQCNLVFIYFLLSHFIFGWVFPILFYNKILAIAKIKIHHFLSPTLRFAAATHDIHCLYPFEM